MRRVSFFFSTDKFSQLGEIALVESDEMHAGSNPPNLLNLKVGKIIECVRHENADSLYVSRVQINQDGDLLQICSGLVNYMRQDQLLNSEVIVLTNLKPSKMRGVRSEAMLLAAEKKSMADQEQIQVKLVKPPTGSSIGDRLYFQGFKSDDSPSKLKSNAWQEIQKCLKTNSKGEAFYEFEDAEPCYLQNEQESNATAELEDAIIR
ncbi:hypothetical protein CLIB1423_18S00210 [[Candida] railenensis]|uniref:tRNA-binding domain-containing protein n=1 Tax=[Candida] railenensis TaxID=45579 RepID=A0A9P0W051_9ASCO|nr:hypothetical protein CLIB1423_18S00210 [[Candida] railenensis]